MMCNVGEGEDPAVCETRILKAKKDHVCCECGSTIAKGEEYESVSGLWPDSGWARFKTCAFCSRVRDDNHQYGVIPFEDLWDCVGYGYKLEA